MDPKVLLVSGRWLTSHSMVEPQMDRGRFKNVSNLVLDKPN